MRNNLNRIVRYLKSSPSANGTLSWKFIEKGWLAAIANPTEDQLVTLLLGRIEYDANQYGEFIDMLRDIEGMDLIVKSLTGMAYHLSISLP